jgi:hypothetical protein
MCKCADSLKTVRCAAQKNQKDTMVTVIADFLSVSSARMVNLHRDMAHFVVVGSD